MLPFRQLLRKMLALASGEFAGRACAVLSIILIGRRYGTAALGVYALAQSLSQYTQPLIDFGLRHIGARLISVIPSALAVIVRRVQARRLLMAAGTVPLLLVYSRFLPLAFSARLFVFAFAFCGLFYALSLDWAAWGRDDLRLVGLIRTMVPLSILVFVAFSSPDNYLWFLVLGIVAGQIAQCVLSRLWLRRQVDERRVSETELATITHSLAWRRTSIMGFAWLSNLAFNNIDILMLGILADASQVGLYSASYRILNQVLAVYYLMTQALYPNLARYDRENRKLAIGKRTLWLLFGAGLICSALVAATGKLVLGALLGAQFFPAYPLLVFLAFAIPFDFVTSFLSNAYIAWALEKQVLACTAIAACCNVLLNLLLIPKYGAQAAAINTLVAYAVFLCSLLVVSRRIVANPPAANSPQLALT